MRWGCRSPRSAICLCCKRDPTRSVPHELGGTVRPGGTGWAERRHLSNDATRCVSPGSCSIRYCEGSWPGSSAFVVYPPPLRPPQRGTPLASVMALKRCREANGRPGQKAAATRQKAAT